MLLAGGKKKRIVVAYLFILPALGIFLVFRISPIIIAAFVSFYNFKIAGFGQEVSFVGLKNYLDLLGNPVFWHIIRNTVAYTAIVVPSTALISLGLAVFLNKQFKLARLFEAIYFFPIITSMVAISAIWTMLYQPVFGLINHLLSAVGLPTQGWLLDPRLSLVSVAIVIIWTNVGYYIVIFLAGLNNIPRMYYESARIDGAGSFTCFTRITLPLLKPIMLFVIVMLTIISLKIFTPVYLLTLGGPGDSSKSAGVLIYEYAFSFYRYSYATAIAIVMLVIILVSTLLEHRFIR